MSMRRSMAVAGVTMAAMAPGGEAQGATSELRAPNTATAALGSNALGTPFSTAGNEAGFPENLSDPRDLNRCLKFYADVTLAQDERPRVHLRTPDFARVTINPTNNLGQEITDFWPACGKIASGVKRQSVLRVYYGGKKIGAKEVITPRVDDGRKISESLTTKRPMRNLGKVVTKLFTTARHEDASRTEHIRFR